MADPTVTSTTPPDAQFETITCRDWPQLVEKLGKLESGWLFRGERCSDWVLKTNLERHTPSGKTGQATEAMLLEEFQRRAHLYLEPHHIPTNILEWWATMQHHGAPTRLLDFTASPYVAAYFAVEDATKIDGHCAVWAVNKYSCYECAGKLFEAAYPVLQQVIKDPFQIGFSVSAAPGLFERYMMSDPRPIVLPTVPKKFNERLSLQQGYFLCPGDVDLPFMNNLAAICLQKSDIKKFVFPNRHRPRALEVLRVMNITRATLFPGLDGFAQSFRQLPVEESTEDRKRRYILQALTESIETKRAASEEPET